jgi:hypothetical protein
MTQDIHETGVQHAVIQVESQPAVWIGGPGSHAHAVVGEEYAHQHMQHVAAAIQARTDLPMPAWLTPEINGLAVWVMGSKIGYLPPPTASAWHQVVTGLRARYNLPVACQATLDPPSAANQGVLGILVWLPVFHAASCTPAQTELGRLETELSKSKQELEAALTAARAAAKPEDELKRVQAELQRVQAELERRKGELGSVEEALEIQSFGFYQPRYGFVVVCTVRSATHGNSRRTARAHQKRFGRAMRDHLDGCGQQGRGQEDGEAASQTHAACIQWRV